ncbi:MAG: hypothetical protein JWN48_2227 [Myxococcaceae bacterium]|nr:hypothetical protein [Myxococcaceae bacterium]
MSKWLCTCAAALLFACGDGIVGYDECVDPDAGYCATSERTAPIYLDVGFDVLQTVDNPNLTVTWRLDNPCPSPCAVPTKLWPAGGGSAWTAPRSGLSPSVQLLDSSGPVGPDPVQIAPPPANSTGLQRLFVSASANGESLVHTQWSGLNQGSAAPDEIYVVNRTLVPGPTAGVVRSISLKAPTRFTLPLGVIGVPSGFLLFDDSVIGGASASLYDPAGQFLWQTQALPDFSASLGGSAAKTSAGYVLAASDGSSKLPAYGMLELDEQGSYSRFAFVSSSSWRSAMVLPLPSPATFAVAASSDITGVGIPGVGRGNIDVVYGNLELLKGFRIKPSCTVPLNLYGFSVDSRGALYVSSVGGTETEPRGLLCRMLYQAPGQPLSAPRCYQTEPNVLLGPIVANDRGGVIAVLGQLDTKGDFASEQIVGIDLP